ncbi:MAG: putative nickel-responsive regulator [Candidatus Heimdallarchaeota archaeon LC_3]|nr:MAG: putative nickel-responsive regulator [Candidatus Heimdallarchaeota archaeon LC_3]
MGIIPINLDEEIIEKIDLLVRQGRYKNRSEALRDQITKNLDKISIVSNPEVSSERYQKLLETLINLPSPPQFLNTKKSLTELVSEGRDR